MLLSVYDLKSLLSEALLTEVDIEDVGDLCFTAGSTHVMRTCKIGKDKYYLKFSDESLFDDVDPSLQILVEYLAYCVYGLYADVAIPKVDLVYDKEKQSVGLASSSVSGKPGLRTYKPEKLGKMLSSGVLVDIFLANWDVVGTGTGNVLVDKEKATRIDPGGALTFRAQGGRKGSKFSPEASELKTMLDKSFGGAGTVLSHADMKLAAKSFMSVSWQEVSSVITTVGEDITVQLTQRGMKNLANQWKGDVALIHKMLGSRYKVVQAHAKYVLSH